MVVRSSDAKGQASPGLCDSLTRAFSGPARVSSIALRRDRPRSGNRSVRGVLTIANRSHGRPQESPSDASARPVRQPLRARGAAAGPRRRAPRRLTETLGSQAPPVSSARRPHHATAGAGRRPAGAFRWCSAKRPEHSCSGSRRRRELGELPSAPPGGSVTPALVRRAARLRPRAVVSTSPRGSSSRGAQGSPGLPSQPGRACR